jgi:aspartate/methionine/tyrosine aminotransferase
MSGSNFESVVDFARRNNIILINDNPYSFILNDHPRSILRYTEKNDFVLELNSLSKSHNMAGWRIGVVSGHADLISIVLRFKSNMDSGMFLPIQLSAIKALEEDKTWYLNLNNTYRHRREQAWKFLDRLSCAYSKKQTGMFVWARIPDTWDSSDALSDAILHQAGVFVTPGHIFGKQGDKYIRVSLCSNEDLWQSAHERIMKKNIEPIENRKLKIA